VRQVAAGALAAAYRKPVVGISDSGELRPAYPRSSRSAFLEVAPNPYRVTTMEPGGLLEVVLAPAREADVVHKVTATAVARAVAGLDQPEAPGHVARLPANARLSRLQPLVRHGLHGITVRLFGTRGEAPSDGQRRERHDRSKSSIAALISPRRRTASTS
jgi:hypothetical protein